MRKRFAMRCAYWLPKSNTTIFERPISNLLFYFILHTSYFILHTSYFILHTSYFTLHTSYFILHTSYFLLLTSFATCFDELAEKWLRAVRSALEFRMELNAEHPRVIRHFANFNEVTFWVYAGNNKTCLLKVIAVLVVELIAMAVALPDCRCSVRL